MKNYFGKHQIPENSQVEIINEVLRLRLHENSHNMKEFSEGLILIVKKFTIVEWPWIITIWRDAFSSTISFISTHPYITTAVGAALSGLLIKQIFNHWAVISNTVLALFKQSQNHSDLATAQQGINMAAGERLNSLESGVKNLAQYSSVVGEATANLIDKFKHQNSSLLDLSVMSNDIHLLQTIALILLEESIKNEDPTAGYQIPKRQIINALIGRIKEQSSEE